MAPYRRYVSLICFSGLRGRKYGEHIRAGTYHCVSSYFLYGSQALYRVAPRFYTNLVYRDRVKSAGNPPRKPVMARRLQIEWQESASDLKQRYQSEPHGERRARFQ